MPKTNLVTGAVKVHSLDAQQKRQRMNALIAKYPYATDELKAVCRTLSLKRAAAVLEASVAEQRDARRAQKRDLAIKMGLVAHDGVESSPHKLVLGTPRPTVEVE